jgi:hypothetical protein
MQFHVDYLFSLHPMCYCVLCAVGKDEGFFFVCWQHVFSNIQQEEVGLVGYNAM